MAFLFSLLLITIIWFGYDQLFRLKPTPQISQRLQNKLHQLGEDALHKGEVPVSALLLYKGEVIGEGGNQVFETKRLSEHAEVVALNQAYSKFGDDFFKLDRNRLIMYTTFEPCDMCKGALNEYRVKHIKFEFAKPFSMQLKFKIKRILMELNKSKFKGKGTQEELFEAHPNYPKNKKN